MAILYDPPGIKPIVPAIHPLESAAPWAWRRGVSLYLPMLDAGRPRDYSSNRHAVTQIGTVPSIVSKLGRATDVSSSSNLWSIADHPSLRVQNDFTIEILVEPTSTGGEQAAISKSIDGGAPNRAYEIGIRSGNWRANAFIDGTYDYFIAGSIPAVAGQPAHVVSTRIGTVWSLYVNGRLAGSRTLSGPLNGHAGSLFLGALLGNGAENFSGRYYLASVRSYGLTATEVAALAADPFAPFRPPRRIFGGFDFGDTGGSETLAFQQDSSDGSTGVTEVNVTLNGVTRGQLLVASLMYPFGRTLQISDNQANAYGAPIGGAPDALRLLPDGSRYLAVYSAIASQDGDVTITVAIDGAGTRLGMTAVAYDGLWDHHRVEDVAYGDTAVAGTNSSTAGATASGDAIFHAALVGVNQLSAAAGGGFSNLEETGVGRVVSASRVVLGGATDTAEFSHISSIASAALLVYRPFASSGEGGGEEPIELVVGSTIHGHTSDTPALTQAHILAGVDGDSHGHTADSPSLTQTHILAGVDGDYHGHSSDSPALTQTHQLAGVDGDTHGHSSDSPSLTQGHELGGITGDTHGHTADSPAITQAHVLDGANGDTHGHTADSPSVTVGGILEAEGGLHAHTADEPALTQANSLSVTGDVHGHLSDNVELTQAISLAVSGVLHGHTADSPSLTQALTLAIQDALHGHTADSPSLTQAVVLAVQDVLHLHYSDTVHFGERLSPLEIEVVVMMAIERIARMASAIELEAEL